MEGLDYSWESVDSVYSSGFWLREHREARELERVL